MSFVNKLVEYLSSDHKVIGISTTEERRVRHDIVAACHRLDAIRTERAKNNPSLASRVVGMYWSPIQGFSRIDARRNIKANGQTELIQDPIPSAFKQVLENEKNKDPVFALNTITTLETEDYSFVFMMHDLDHAFESQQVRMRVKNLNEFGMSSPSYVIVMSAALDMNKYPKLSNTIAVLEYDLPGPEDLEETVRMMERSAEESKSLICKDGGCTDELREHIVKSLRGLTVLEAENAICLATVRCRAWDNSVLDVVRSEKARVINQSEALKYTDLADINAEEELGGYEALIDWLKTRKLSYTKLAAEQKMDLPKGIFLIGCAGTGKSVAAKTAAKVLGLPLFVLDIGSVFGGLVGQSEGNLRKALRQVTAQGGCVLMIDEIDKGLNQAHTASGDSGTTSRVFGTLLSWLANKKDHTFVFVTANRTTGLPAELLRAGRFDKMFYTDIPTKAERRKIIEIHLKKRNVDPTTVVVDDGMWNELCVRTEGFVGSELEQVVIDARYMAFASRGIGTPNAEEWFKAIDSVTPLCKLDPEGLNAVRDFCKTRAAPVNGTAVTTTTTTVATPRRRTLSNVDNTASN